jgi:hypothetical protein
MTKQKIILSATLICFSLAGLNACKKGASQPPQKKSIEVKRPWNTVVRSSGYLSNPVQAIEISYRVSVQTKTQDANNNIVTYDTKAKTANPIISGTAGFTPSAVTFDLNLPEKVSGYLVYCRALWLDCGYPMTNLTAAPTIGGTEEYEATSPIFTAPQDMTITKIMFKIIFEGTC